LTRPLVLRVCELGVKPAWQSVPRCTLPPLGVAFSKFPAACKGLERLLSALCAPSHNVNVQESVRFNLIHL